MSGRLRDKTDQREERKRVEISERASIYLMTLIPIDFAEPAIVRHIYVENQRKEKKRE